MSGAVSCFPFNGLLPSWLGGAYRSWKYDASLLEFFVERQETVKIRRSDLEMSRVVETGEENDGSVPARKALMDVGGSAASEPASGLMPEGTAAPDPKQLGDLADTKQKLDQFLESLHKKASQATAWVVALEPPSLEQPTQKQKELLGEMIFGVKACVYK